MKKILSILLSAMMLLSLYGCAKSDQSNTSSASQTSLSSVMSSEISTENDGLFDPSAYVNEEVFDFERIELGSELEKACKTYQFTFMSDGYRINGYISIPIASIESQKPTKCLVYCRGGNSRYGTLDDRATALRCYYSGRVVVGCERRGCNGTEGVEQFGGDDLNDVVKLIDLCDKRFDFIDMDDLCVEGESRGGMMTYMTARRDARVKKIIVCSGISNLFLSYQERDDMKEGLRGFIGGSPEEVPEEYERRSAVYWADEINIPVLIIHSKMDKQVSFSHAQQMYEKLKDHNNCTLITHDDDFHGVHDEDITSMFKWLEEN